MKKRKLALLVLLATLVMVSSPASAQGSSHYFPETSHTVKGRFLQYWQQHGGLAQQGYPLSDELQERSDTDGKVYTVQYFERAVFELHPENQPPNDVLLSLLGNFRYKQIYPRGASNQQVSSENPRFFTATGMTLGGKFRAYWESHGGLAQQGYPISNEFHEVGTDGVSRTVQYFERAVFELHPENAGTPYEVLLTQLGTLRYHAPLPVEDLYSIDMISPTEGWAIGSKGIILHYNGGRWQQVSSPVQDGSYLNSISMDSAEDGWAVGDGVMLHYASGRWQENTEAPALLNHSAGKPWPKLIGVSMTSANEGWAITGDAAGGFLHYTNGIWSLDLAASSVSLVLRVKMNSAQEGWALGVYDILHYSNGSWSPVQMVGHINADSPVLRDLSMVSASDGWAVGRGYLYRYDGTKWNELPSPTSVDLFGVQMLSANEGWAVGGVVPTGGGGTILHYDGNKWTPYSSPTDKALYALKMVSPSEGWAVGEAGTILHYQNGAWSVYQQ